MTTDDDSTQDDVSGGQNVLLSELEVDERRALIFDSMVREHGERWNNDEGRKELAEITSQLLPMAWLQDLTLEQVAELSALEGWDWYGCLGFEDENGFTIRDLVGYRLVGTMSYLLEEGDEMLANDLLGDENTVAESMDFLRRCATKYGFTFQELFTLGRDKWKHR